MFLNFKFLILLRFFFPFRYDDEVEELSSYQRIPLQFLEKIEIGDMIML